jgi:putative aminopeptidase FrvX
MLKQIDKDVKYMEKRFFELLDIHGVSGDEGRVRDYLIKELAQTVDKIKVDNYGNLLAEKKFNGGKGSVVMLSSHMDTVRGVLNDRKVIKDNKGNIHSNKGALGADDRAGIAIILATYKKLLKENDFTGTVKFAFSREEEIGCVGSSKIDKNFYKDVDLAIVVDRRGNSDIVGGCYSAFCSNAVGDFMEHVAKCNNLDFRMVEGGISDAVTFSENGINSVNISAGYYNEHTDKEYASIYDMEKSLDLLMGTFDMVNTYKEAFGSVPKDGNDWVGKKYSSAYFEDDYYNYYDDMWYEESDPNGEVFAYGDGNNIYIEQGDQLITLNKSTLDSIVTQIYIGADK